METITEKEQKKVINFLNGMVNNRFNIEQLKLKLSEFFGQNIEIELANDDYLTDYNLMFNIEDGTWWSGYYDIYYLPMRREGFDGANMYITEIGYEFI